VEARFGPFGDIANPVARSCMVCAERTIGFNVILDAPDGIVGDVGHVESRLSSFGDSVSIGANRCMVCDKHTIGSEIIMDATDGTPR
jgi:hypothetical protein